MKLFLILAFLAAFKSLWGQGDLDLSPAITNKRANHPAIDYVFPDGSVQLRLDNSILKVSQNATLIGSQQLEFANHEFFRASKIDKTGSTQYLFTTDNLYIGDLRNTGQTTYRKIPLPMTHYSRDPKKVYRKNFVESSIDIIDAHHVLYSELCGGTTAESHSETASGSFDKPSYMRMILVNTSTGEAEQHFGFINEYLTGECGFAGVVDGKKVLVQTHEESKTSLDRSNGTIYNYEGKGNISYFHVDYTNGHTEKISEISYSTDKETGGYLVDVVDSVVVFTISKKVDKKQYQCSVKLFQFLDGEIVESEYPFPNDLNGMNPAPPLVSLGKDLDGNLRPYFSATIVSSGAKLKESKSKTIFLGPNDTEILPFSLVKVKTKSGIVNLQMLPGVTDSVSSFVNDDHCLWLENPTGIVQKIQYFNLVNDTIYCYNFCIFHEKKVRATITIRAVELEK